MNLITKECKVKGDYIGTITWCIGKKPSIVVYYEGDPNHNKNEFWFNYFIFLPQYNRKIVQV